MMKQILNQNSAKFYYLPFFGIWLILLLLNSFAPKFELHAQLNSFHSPSTDLFFQYNTYLGDGLFAILLVILFFFKHRKFALILLATFLLSSLVTQFLKNIIFDDAYRPFFYIQKGMLHVPVVSGIKMHQYNSFPSGHTTTIFALTGMLSLYFNNKLTGILLLFGAFLIGYSRIYLSQHFLADVLAGSAIGGMTSLILYYFFRDSLNIESNKI